MRRFLLLMLPLGASVVGTASAQGTQIPIQNAGFEADVLNCAPGPNCWNSAVPGWLPGWLNGEFSGTIKPGTGQYPGGVPGAVNVAFLGGSQMAGSIFQTVGSTLQANTTYTLRFSLGHRADDAFTGYVATLLAGSVAVAYDDSLNPAAGTFVEDTITYSTGATPALRGQLLAISIKSVGTGQANIANVSLTYSPAP
jgi:hypothetical protein